MKLEGSISLIEKAIKDKQFSAAQLCISQKGEIVFSQGFGKCSFKEDSGDVHESSLFDLASLTKPLATATASALLISEGKLSLNDPVFKYFDSWKTDDKAKVTVKMLLEHTSGLPAWMPYYEEVADLDNQQARCKVFDLAIDQKLENPPATKETYSDIGYIITAAIIEKITSTRLDLFVENEIYARLGIKELFFLPVDASNNKEKLAGKSVVETGNELRGQLSGVVHDDNSYAAGGISGQAGLFGTAKSVTQLLLEWRKALSGQSKLIPKETALDFQHPYTSLPRQCHTPGWDRPTWKVSQAGRYISPHSIGHLGFTGTSCWLDTDHDLTITLLTNRVLGECTTESMGAFRKSIHETLYKELAATGRGPWRRIDKIGSKTEVHLSAIAGTAMGSLAGLLKEAGYKVRGSDEAIYPPMSDQLAELGIEVETPFSISNLQPAPDAVVVGNVCSRNHPEAVQTQRLGLPYESLPSAIDRFFLPGRTSLVATGTHGKTTTSSLLAWLLDACGYDPGFMIGGVLENFGRSFRLGTGPEFVLEGDEYDSAYFDKYPKFMHYRPQGAILTSIEFDHADIYDSIEEIEERFKEFVDIIPESGILLACRESERVVKIASKAKCRVVYYGLTKDCQWCAEEISTDSKGTRLTLLKDGQKVIGLETQLTGKHNLMNICAACALLVERGLDPAKLPAALKSFKGIARRQNIYGPYAGVRIIDDFAHHPTAIALTLEGLRRAYPEGKMLVAFDPATNTTSRNIFQKELSECFEGADTVVLGPPSRPDRIPPEERLDMNRLISDLQARGIKAYHRQDVTEILKVLLEQAKAGDSIVVMSNRSFGGLRIKLVDALSNRAV